MKNFGVITFESSSTVGIDNMANEFIRREKVEVVNISLTSWYDEEHSCAQYVLAMSYSYTE